MKEYVLIEIESENSGMYGDSENYLLNTIERGLKKLGIYLYHRSTKNSSFILYSIGKMTKKETDETFSFCIKHKKYTRFSERGMNSIYAKEG